MKTKNIKNMTKKITLLISLLVILKLTSIAQNASYAYFDASDKSYIDYGRGLDLNSYKKIKWWKQINHHDVGKMGFKKY